MRKDNAFGSGFLSLNKPAGLTSHDCVARVRRLLGLKRVGHGGTLDPAATGVLPIALDKATRLLQFLPEDKAYRATIRLGVRTTTDDLEGEAIATQSARYLKLDEVQLYLNQFQGKIQQIPPNYSAIQVKGKRLYELARKGDKIDVPARTVEVYKIEVLDWREGEFPELDVAIACGLGTYIRAIARDLGAALEVGGTLVSLLRTESCGFSLSDSLSIKELEIQIQQHQFSPISPDLALGHLVEISLQASESRRWCQGQRLTVDSLGRADNLWLTKSWVRVKQESGLFLGVGQLLKSSEGLILTPQVVIEQIS